MAKNDIILVDGIVDERVAQKYPSTQVDEVFEFLAFEELLKAYDLNTEELESGWIDGGGDGGIDGFYIFINGHLLDDETSFAWPRTNAAIDIWLITCKHHSKFQQATLDALLATIPEIFDFALDETDLEGTYSAELLEARTLLVRAYRRLSVGRPNVRINVVYASRGDTEKTGESVLARAKQIETTLRELFSSSLVEFKFFGAAEIVESHRKVRAFELDLPFLEHLSTGKESYVLLVNLESYWRFVTDDHGVLRRYLFDSNVRDYLGTNGVNDDIARSLADSTAPDFWWLNNGVTILATSAPVTGKTVRLRDVQIVNGLQTTETIYKHFITGSKTSADRALLVKIIVTSDVSARDRIIRATNNQSPVEVSALRATDKMQRDIEDVLERSGWYYERRKNYYKNVGKPPAQFVTPAYVASAIVSLAFKNVPQATRMKTRFMRDQKSYEDVFSSDVPLDVWPKVVAVYKKTDSALAVLVQEQHRRERLISNWRPLVALLVVSRLLKKFDYSLNEFALLDLSLMTDELLRETVGIVAESSNGLSPYHKVKHAFIARCCAATAERFAVSGLESLGRRKIRQTIEDDSSAKAVPEKRTPTAPPSEELVRQVDGALPAQPWKPGMRRELLTKLKITPRQLSSAVDLLIARGKWHKQINGVVYATDGSVISEDMDRNPK